MSPRNSTKKKPKVLSVFPFDKNSDIASQFSGQHSMKYSKLQQLDPSPIEVTRNSNQVSHKSLNALTETS